MVASKTKFNKDAKTIASCKSPEIVVEAGYFNYLSRIADKDMLYVAIDSKIREMFENYIIDMDITVDFVDSYNGYDFFTVQIDVWDCLDFDLRFKLNGRKRQEYLNALAYDMLIEFLEYERNIYRQWKKELADNH